MDWDSRRQKKAGELLDRNLITPGIWADIGSGDGVFTRLLADWLAPDGEVYAVDRDRRALRTLAQSVPSRVATVHTQVADFTRPLNLPAVDGLLLANALHFVRRHGAVLNQLVQHVAPGGRVIIIEYNASRGNYAVPHPFTDDTCLMLMRDAGLVDARIVNRVPSSFLREMYVAVAEQPIANS